MGRRRNFEGDVTQYETPDWGPLEGLAIRLVCSEFMWMHEVELENGTRVHAYKNIETRRYFHLDADGQFYGYTEEGKYRKMELDEFLTSRVLGWQMWREPPPEPGCGSYENDAEGAPDAYRDVPF